MDVGSVDIKSGSIRRNQSRITPIAQKFGLDEQFRAHSPRDVEVRLYRQARLHRKQHSVKIGDTAVTLLMGSVDHRLQHDLRPDRMARTTPPSP